MHAHQWMNIHVWFKCNFLTCADNAPSKTKTKSNKHTTVRYEKPTFQLLVRLVQETPRTL